MNRYAILCLDNNPVSIQQFTQELAVFSSKFDVITVSTLDEAHSALDYLAQSDHIIALVIASQHSRLNGAEFLIALNQYPHTQEARKILISSSSDIDAILAAVNEGRLDHCLTSPLTNQMLLTTVKKELTDFILNNQYDDLIYYAETLDRERILNAHIDNKMRHYQAGFLSNYHDLSDEELTERVISQLKLFFAKGDTTHACRTYSPMHQLTVEGEPNYFLWFITAGEVALYKNDSDGERQEVIRYGKGNMVGTMSFVSGEPSFSSALTLSKTDVIKLDKHTFTQVMQSHSELLPLFTNLLLRHFNRRLQRSIKIKMELQQTIAVLQSAQQQLIEREKMAMLGQLVAGVAHELNNPIAAILRGVENLTQHLDEIIQQQDAPLSLDIFRHARLSTPLSTVEQRQRINKLGIEDRAIAKKIVQLNQTDNQALLHALAHTPATGKHQLMYLNHYHQLGASLRSVDVCANRIANMVKSLKGYARPDEESWQYSDIRVGIEDTLMIFENKLKRHQVETHYAPLDDIYCQPIALQQVWTNLISNAIDAFDGKGELTISIRRESRNQRHYAVIVFRDNGCGIPAHKQDSIFELNYTSKKEGNFGLGIGLSICQQIIHAHQGWIDVDSQVDLYTSMSVWLPLDLNQGARHE